ncbi:MAG: hypothetical protein DWQ34_03320 [Planctomycetota bacterium]|nr:MAG: hypothetical protein DWQ29_07570 [Planctomycetota bacterium]REJ96774.1 MAG: hypothetical protein DWQ34_03320 [Planctomycetota bacterium]REK25598.1 MAG: hypothetical protein DWQ41_11725 [Planctomycetota bacterium]REK31691.1 MAG: hypothetical protein DWQ45_18960 [Planctomycetota bacterium]
MITHKGLKSEIQESLDQGADHQKLRIIVSGFYAAGGSKDEAYHALEEIWRDFGFDEDDGGQPNPKRDELEYVMEQVWYWDA